MKEIYVSGRERFGNLTVLDVRSVLRGKTSPRKEIQLLCRCELCGSEKWYPKTNVINGHTKSCGCHASRIKHGEWHTRLYGIWSGMKRRCYVTTCKMYKYYGGRGITVCEKWQDYIPFRDWALANGYSDKLTLDRIDVNKNYCPENCRWATYVVQQNNRRNNHVVVYQGKEYTVSELARKLGLSASVVSARLRKGWDVDKAYVKSDFRGHRKLKTYAAFGEEHTAQQWADKLGLSLRAFRRRLSVKGGDMEAMLLNEEYRKYREDFKQTHRRPCSYDYWLAHRE